MANKINVNGIELTIEQTFPYVVKTESIVEETEVTEETTDEVVDEPKDEE